MTGRRVLHAEADIVAAGLERAQQIRDAGWRMPERTAEHVAAILLPARDHLHPPRDHAA